MKPDEISQKKSPSAHYDLGLAVEAFLKNGGKIQNIPQGESGSNTAVTELIDATLAQEEMDSHAIKKAEQLKELIAKGAGISALQYSLRMSRKELRLMAKEQGVAIPYSRPILGVRTNRNQKRANTPKITTDELSGLALHYSLLGYSALEIAQELNVSIRQVWEIAKDCKFELKNHSDK